MSDQIDTVVRFHDVRRLPELKRCIFSLVGQRYRPLRIILTLQRFSAEDIAATRAALASILNMPDAPSVTVVNYEDPEPKDARSALLGLGTRAAQGRYLAFLDYDDVLYPEAYDLLAFRLRETDAAIAFASVRVMKIDVYSQFFYTATSGTKFVGTGLLDLFRKNFCPLHSYVMDRNQIAPEDLSFDPSIIFEEDYDVLLRVCAHLKSDFGLLGVNIGDYYAKNDGSNTVPFEGILAQKHEDHYKHVASSIERRRRTTMVTVPVQHAMGLLTAQAPTSVRDLIDRFPQRTVLGRSA